MIKKARDIQLGDRIGGRVVRIKTTRTGDMITHLMFLDGTTSLEIPEATEVWVDDPVPCCKPSIILKQARDVKPGDIVCYRIARNNNNDGHNALIFTGGYGVKEWPDSQITVLREEVPIDLISDAIAKVLS